MVKMNVREIALQLLIRVEKEGGFSHLLLSNTIKQKQLNEQDEKLLTEIVYGTLERKITLDYYLFPYIQKQKKLNDWVRILLRMSVFQMQFLDKIPTYAIIHEAVEVAKNKGHQGIASFVNGVLRNIDRKGVPDYSKIKDRAERLSIETSHPKWLVERWIKQYGYETTVKMCEANVQPKRLHVRVNRIKTTREAVMEQLEKEGIEADASPYVADAITIQSGNIFKTNLLQTGEVTIQDVSSMLAASALLVEPNMSVLDTCSAPGGKATYLGELMDNQGTVFAHDLHKNKIKLVKQNADRLGLTNIKATQKDARQLRKLYNKGSFDRILVDAPCSGFGVIRSKPDIKYNKQIEDSEKLQNIQLEILTEIAPLMKPGGVLVYSTCTVEKMENEDVIRKFLTEHPNFIVDKMFLDESKKLLKRVQVTSYGVQLFPQTLDSDGFFISRLINVKNSKQR